MDLEELWIGELVQIIKSGKLGRFEGIKDQKARVLVQGKILLVPAHNIKLAPEIKISKSDELAQEYRKSAAKNNNPLSFDPSIDLHIEALDKKRINENPIAILEFQLRKLEEFLAEGIRLRILKLNIIHGKGTGALRMETMNIINSFKEVQSIYPENDGGSLVLYLKYNNSF